MAQNLRPVRNSRQLYLKNSIFLSAKTHRPSVGLKLVHRLHRWPNIKPTLAKRLVFRNVFRNVVFRVVGFALCDRLC